MLFRKRSTTLPNFNAHFNLLTLKHLFRIVYKVYIARREEHIALRYEYLHIRKKKRGAEETLLP